MTAEAALACTAAAPTWPLPTAQLLYTVEAAALCSLLHAGSWCTSCHVYSCCAPTAWSQLSCLMGAACPSRVKRRSLGTGVQPAHKACAGAFMSHTQSTCTQHVLERLVQRVCSCAAVGTAACQLRYHPKASAAASKAATPGAAYIKLSDRAARVMVLYAGRVLKRGTRQQHTWQLAMWPWPRNATNAALM